jgi:hypothetical protein
MDCPYCNRGAARGGGTYYEPCGLYPGEHKRIVKAAKQARQQASELRLEALERGVLPRVIINEVYDQAEHDIRRAGR